MNPNYPTDDPHWDRLIHLVAGELPAEEAAELRRWVEAEPERGQVLARLEEIWRATAPPAEFGPEGWDAEAELQRIRAETGHTGRVIARVGSNFELRPHRSRVASVLAAVAAVVIVTGAGVLWRLGIVSQAAPPASVAIREYRTAPGERLSFHLSDGTQVMLAPGSALRRLATYGQGDRRVHLEGEAYFVVTHDAAKPFSVHTARTIARDLGTRFVVRAYQDEPTTEVVVAEGTVAVGRGGADSVTSTGSHPLSPDSVVVKPRQRATLTDAGRLVLEREVALDRYLSWTEGRLVFEKTALRDVVHRLEAWYGIDVRLASPSLGEHRLTATLEYESAAEALDLVATSLGLSVSRAGNTYVLGPGRP